MSQAAVPIRTGKLVLVPALISLAVTLLHDYVGMPPEFQMPFWPRFLWLAFVPQLIFWVGYTVIIGLLAGTITALALGRRRG